MAKRTWHFYRLMPGFFGLGASYHRPVRQWYIEIGPWVLTNAPRDDD